MFARPSCRLAAVAGPSVSSALAPSSVASSSSAAAFPAVHQRRAKGHKSRQGSLMGMRPVIRSFRKHNKPVVTRDDEFSLADKPRQPLFKDGHLNYSRMDALVSLYHETRHHVTRANLDAYIDAEFAPPSGVPRNRPQMADLYDLHERMARPNLYAPMEQQARLAAGPAEDTGAAVATLGGTGRRAAVTSESSARRAWEAAMDVWEAGSTTGDAGKYVGGGADAVLSERRAALAALEEGAEAPVNDWVGTSESALTPRQRQIIEALYGAEEDRRPGLQTALEEMEMLEVERERAHREADRLLKEREERMGWARGEVDRRQLRIE